MSSTETRSANATSGAGTSKVDMHLEVDVIPVSDVNRAKQFYQRLGWRFDDDAAPLDGLRIVQYASGLRGLGHVRHGTDGRHPRLVPGHADRL